MAHTSVAEATVTAGDTFYTVDPALATYPTTGKISGSVLLVSANITTTPTPVTAANGLYVQPGTSTTWAVTQSGSWTVAVTGVATAANQATEIASLASIDGKLPALGQALAAASVPVVLTAAQITTLTPPAAITGFATSAKQDTQITSLGTLAGAVSGTEMQVDVLTMPTVAVTGTFWQATQPVSHSTLAVVGGGTEATAMRVTIASDSTGVVSIDDNGGSITVDGTVAITSSALTNIQSGYHNIDEVAGGTDTGTAILAIRDDALASLTPVEGDWNALRVNARGATWIAIEDGAGGQITSFSGGTQYAEDAAHVSGNTGTLALVVRSDTAASTAGTDGDYTALITDSTGRLHCNVSNTLTVASHAVTNAGTFAVQAVCTNAGTFAVQAAQSGTWNITNVSGTVSLPTGASTAAKQPALGTAGTASADVITVQGIASMTALKVDGSAVTQPVSLTSTTVTGTVAVTQSGTWDEVGINDSGNSITVDWAGTAPPIGAGLEATALRVTLATDSTGVVSVDDNGSSLTVDYATTGSGTATGAIRVELPTNGTGVIATVGAVTAITNALPAGTNAIGKLATNSGVDIGDVDVTSIIPGTGATNLGKAIDTATGGTDTGVLVLATRDDALSALTPIEGDNVQLRTDGNGALWVIPSGTITVASHAVTNAGTFVVQVDGTALTRLTDIETNTDSLAVVGNGAAATAQRVSIANDSTGILAGVTTVTTVTTCSTLTALTGGGVAHDGVDSGNPVKIGVKATTSLSGLTLVANADRTDLFAGIDGVMITRPHCNLEDIVQERTTNTDGASTAFASGLAAPGAGVRLYIKSIDICNSSAAMCTVDLRDGAAGSVLWTLPVPATGGVVKTFDPPLKLTANTALAFDASAATTTLTISANGFKSKI